MNNEQKEAFFNWMYSKLMQELPKRDLSKISWFNYERSN